VISPQRSFTCPDQGRAHEGQTRNSQVVHDDLSHVQGQRAGTALPARGRCPYQNGDRGKHGEVVRGYVACGVTDRSAKQVEHRYRKRSGIETTYRLLRQARGITTTRDPVVRFAIMLVAALLENLWLVLRWAVVARPRRAGATCPRSSRSRRSVTGFVMSWKRSYAAGGRSKRTGLECQHHRQRPRADRGQPTACQLAVSDSFRQIPSKSG